MLNKINKVLNNKKILRKISKQTNFKNNKRFFILSFDCDNSEDPNAILSFLPFLEKNNVPAVFAVPGMNLLENQKKYKEIHSCGYEFINHGFLKHVNPTNSKSITFYNEMSKEDVRNDIINGHNTIKKVLNYTANGFRAPHFGYVQNKSDLSFLYETVANLNYTYCTTTMPDYAIKNGSIIKVSEKLFEFPLSGQYNFPYRILDSYTSFYKRKNKAAGKKKYIKNLKKAINFYADNKLACILNYYVDPSHILDFEDFFQTLLYAIKKGFKMSNYSQIINPYDQE